MPTLMLSPRHCVDSKRLRVAALERGWPVVRWSSWRVPEGLDESEELFLYASPLFAERVSQLLPLRFDEPPDDWPAHLSPDLTRRQIHFTTLQQAREKKGRHFFKPAGFKSFVAGVYESGEELPDESKADPAEPVIVSEVVRWASEFRFFLLDGKALAGSVYYRFGESAQSFDQWPSQQAEYRTAQEVAERAWRETAERLPRSVVIDTGLIEGRGWAVIEANPSWGSGLYGCAVEPVLDVIRQAAHAR